MKSAKRLLVTSVTALAAFATHAQNIVANGSFESDVQAPGSWAIYNSLIGWTGVPDVELRNNVAGTAQDGVNYVELDTTHNSAIQQQISGTGLYELSFWYSARPGVASGSNGLDFSLGNLSGSVLQTATGGSVNSWQHYTGLVALGGSTTLQFSASGASDSLGGSLDNISVTAVPEPATYAMLLAGLGLMGGIAHRRKNQQS